MFSGRPCMCVCICLSESLWTQYFLNCLGEFRHIYNFGAFGDKDELIRFWAQKVKSQGYHQNKHGDKVEQLCIDSSPPSCIYFKLLKSNID